MHDAAVRRLIPALLALALGTVGASAGDAGLRAAQADLAIALMSEALAGGPSRNVVFSPLSAAAALGGTSVGASPKTGAAIAGSLGLGSDPQAPIRLLDAAKAAVGGKDAPATLALRIVFDDGLALKPEGKNLLDRHGITHAVDRLETAGAVETVNLWVKDATAGAIPAILDAPPGGGFVALAALSFKGSWKTTFPPAQDAPFHRPDKPDAKASMMKLASLTAAFRTDDRFAAVDLPYSDGAYGMVVVTARDGKGVTQADLPKLAGWLGGGDFVTGEGAVTLPRFALSEGADITETLEKRGLAAAGSDPNAFAGFTADGLAIARVVQKTVVTVDEAGTQAASASAVVAERSVGKTGFVQVEADSPFIFCLRETRSGLILAAGLVADPGQPPPSRP